MTLSADSTPITEAAFIAAPRDPDLQTLYEYWDAKRAGRAMPRRSDIDPGEIRPLLPYLVMYDVAPGGGEYNTRLLGSELEHFVGRNTTGHPAGTTMTPRAAAMMVRILDLVASERAPKFRAGTAHWQPDKTYRDFEACFLPLSADGETVNMILGGVKFPL